MTVWQSKVKDCKGVLLEGRNRTHGFTVERTLQQLMSEAEAASGVFGPGNIPVSDEMTVKALTDWHADYDWRLL